MGRGHAQVLRDVVAEAELADSVGRIADTIQALGVTRFTMKYSAGVLPHEKLMRCIELFGREVVPRVRQLLQEKT